MTATAANRNSGLHFLRSGITPLFPDGSIIQQDRQSSTHSYGGILALTLDANNAGINSSQTIWFFFDDDEIIS